MAFPRETPLKKVLGLGSAHEGTTHFWRQRLTGLANLFLAAGFVILIVAVAGRRYAEVAHAHGVQTQMTITGPGREGLCLLELGESYVIAERFTAS